MITSQECTEYENDEIHSCSRIDIINLLRLEVISDSDRKSGDDPPKQKVVITLGGPLYAAKSCFETSSSTNSNEKGLPSIKLT